MAADNTYFPGRFHVRQNGQAYVPSGSTLYLESGGVAKVESGGTISVASGGALTLLAGGTLTLSTGAKLITTLTTGSTAGTLLNHGPSMIKSTSGVKVYPIAAPTVGCLKHIHVQSATTTNMAKLDAGSGRTFDGSNRYLVFKRNNAGAVLVGYTTARWGMVAQSGSTVHVTYVNS